MGNARAITNNALSASPFQRLQLPAADDVNGKEGWGPDDVTVDTSMARDSLRGPAA